MAPRRPVDGVEPAAALTQVPVRRSRLPAPLRILILAVLNLGINTALWSFVSNFLSPELGAVSKVPHETDNWSVYSPGARVLMRVVTLWMQWYFNYDCKTRVRMPSGRRMANLGSL